MNTKLSWNEYHMKLAEIIKLRSPDPNRKVGAVLVSLLDNHIISTGYNGLVSGSNDQIDWSNRELVKSLVIHAETNCLLHCRNLTNEPLKMYITTSPCKECIKLIATLNIKEIYYKIQYTDITLVKDICEFYDIKLLHLI
jgi:dCMP deaminase